MLIRSIVVVLACAVASIPASAQKITLSGKAQSCHPGMPIRLVGVPDVEISAFQVSRVPTIMSNLKAMDRVTITSEESMMRLLTLSSRTYRLVMSSKALTRVVSDSTGSFKLNIPATDSVVVYAFGHDPDSPVDEAYVTLSGRTNSSFVIDMEHGGCTP